MRSGLLDAIDELIVSFFAISTSSPTVRENVIDMSEGKWYPILTDCGG